MALTASSRAALEAVLASLDLEALGAIYCHEGGVDFWHATLPQVATLGVPWADALGGRLERGGTSLYVGAGVAELPALLTETLDLGRRCVATNLREREVEVLNAALVTGGIEGLRFEATDAAEVAAGGSFDHLGMVSVLNDPETFPQLSAVSYGTASPLDLDPVTFEAERERVRTLVATVLGGLRLPALITTTFEEAPWILERADALGLAVTGDDVSIDTAVVGDPCGFLRLEAVR